jgi:hypothetical protein
LVLVSTQFVDGVIGSDGALTGYGDGLWRKRWLIAHECRVARQGPTSGME